MFKTRINQNLLLLLSLLCISTISLAQHPRIFITSARVQQIKAAIAITGSHHKEAYTALKARVDAYDWQKTGVGAYDRSWIAREASLLYLLTEDKKYSNIAFEVLKLIYTNPETDRFPDKGYGLSRAMIGLGFGIAYDWAYNGWTTEQRTYIKDKITLSLNAWPSYSHTNLSATDKASNWVAVCRGGELVLMLTAGEEVARASRYTQLKGWLNTHLANAYGPSGFMQEGLAYNYYAGSFLTAAVHAARSIGDTGFDTQFNSKAFWKLLMNSFATDRKHIMTGVDGGGMIMEGWSSLLLGTVPANMAPYYKFYYDRFMGIKAGKIFDRERAGTTWALIYYPENIAEADPTLNISKSQIDDKKGSFLFRNQWKDQTDIIVGMMGDYEHHNAAWDSPEAFQLGLIYNGTRYIGGPAKGQAASGFSALLVDGKAGTGGDAIGAKDFSSSTTDGGGYVIADGGNKYTKLGLTAAKRHLLVNFPSGGVCGSIMSTLDKVQSTISRNYTWQLNLGSDADNGGVVASKGIENGRPYFLLKGANNGYVKGWVMNHPTAAIVEGDPLKISVSGTTQNIWVVMTVCSGIPPVATFSGSGMNTIITINGKTVQYNTATDRIISSASAPTVGAVDVLPLIEKGNAQEDAVDTASQVADEAVELEVIGLSSLPKDGVENKSGIQMKPGHEIIIFSSEGQEIFRKKDDKDAWKGINNGGLHLSKGNYFYLIRDSKGRKVKTGSIIVIRE